MKVLMISTDARIFDVDSEVRRRMIDYGGLVEELHIVVKIQNSKVKSQNFGNVFIYSTNTLFKPLYFLAAYKIAQKILVVSGQWLITSQDPFETGLVGYWLKKKFGIPLQIQIHTDFLSHYFWRESVKNKIRVLLAKWLVRKADGIRVVSERIKFSLSTLYPKPYTLNPIFVLPVFVDIQKIRQAPTEVDLHKKYPGYDSIVLMASRFTPEKNITLALQSFVAVVKAHPKALLLIVGEGPEERNLKLKTKELNFEDSVKFEAWTDKLASYYKSADIYLLTSNYEGYGRTAIEAAAAELPVVMTDVGVAIGKVVPVGDTEALQNALKEIMENVSARKKILESQKSVLSGWTPYERYLDEIRAGWECALTARGRRLLFITQKVDADDDLLGVYHEWIKRLAEKFETTVICLYRGRVDLPANVFVYSLGKEQMANGISRIGKRLIYAANFYKYIWRLRNSYDAVFVHMNPEYAILGGLIWRLMGKRIILWYAHYLGTFKLRIAAVLAHKIVTSTRLAYPFVSRKLEVLQQGIDTSRFKPANPKPLPDRQAGQTLNPKFKILFLGRIAPVKHIEILLDAFALVLKTKPNVSLTVVGSPTPGKEIEYQYFEKIKGMIDDLGIARAVSLRAAVSHSETPEIYRTHDLFVNLTDTGSFDKTTLEAMACGLPVLVSNKAFLGFLSADLRELLMFKEQDALDLAAKLKILIEFPQSKRLALIQEMRRLILEKHSLNDLSDKLVRLINEIS